MIVIQWRDRPGFALNSIEPDDIRSITWCGVPFDREGWRYGFPLFVERKDYPHPPEWDVLDDYDGGESCES